MHSVLSEPQDPIGLEKAAVNHSNQALANQVEGAQCSNGNDIKTETLEDDWRRRVVLVLSGTRMEKDQRCVNMQADFIGM